jgi:hypothetical protein
MENPKTNEESNNSTVFEMSKHGSALSAFQHSSAQLLALSKIVVTISAAGDGCTFTLVPV